MARSLCAAAAALAVASTVLADKTSAPGDLSAALNNAYFMNSGTVKATDMYAYVPIACQYLEPENVTAAQSSWGQGGSCPYLYQLTAPPAPPSECNRSAATPGFDRMGGDYRTQELATDDWTQCPALCCADTQCTAWVYTPSGPGNFMQCTQGSHCCYLKGTSPAPTNSSVPGITSGSVSRPLPSVATPPLGMRSAIPLGGVGAGALELRADGTFHEVTIENSSPAGAAKFGVMSDALLGLRVTPSGGSAVTKAVRTHPPAYAAGQGVDSITYSGTYPHSKLALADATLAGTGVTASLHAYSTLKPGDLPASAAPAAAFTLQLSNSGTAAAEVSFLFTLPWAAMNDCARPAQSGQGSTTVSTPDAPSCMQACAAAAPANCSSWTFAPAASGPGTCTMVDGVAWNVYREGQSCGVRGSWAAPSPGTEAGLTYSQADALGRPSPASGDLTLLAVLDSDQGPAQPVSVSYGVASDVSSLWAAYTAAGAFAPSQTGVTAAPFVGVQGAVGGAVASTILPAGASATLTIVFSWYFPHRDHMGQDIGNLYSTLWDSSASVASSLSSQERLVEVVTTINAHHAVFAGPGNPSPVWVQDMALNQMSHFRGMIATRDGRLREFEAFDCPDVDSIHNDYQRHLPYIWLFPVFERSKMMEWGAGQATDGHIWEYLGSFGLGPLDQPGGRIMGDTTTLWITELYELWKGTGDFPFLQAWWPTAVKALQWQAGPACVNNGVNQGLPSHLVCTYDIIDFAQYNTTTFNAYLHLLAMRAGQEMATAMGDSATAALTQAAYTTAQASLQALLWNTTTGYYRAYTGGDAIMADCLYGLMLSLHHGLGWTVPSNANGTAGGPPDLSLIQSHLAAELKYNGNAYGLAVVTGRHTPPPMAAGDARKSSSSSFARRAAAVRTAMADRLSQGVPDYNRLGPSAAELLGLHKDAFVAHRATSSKAGSKSTAAASTAVGGWDTQDDVDWMGAGPDWSYVAVKLAVAQQAAATGKAFDPLPPATLATLLDPANRSMGQYRTGLADVWNIAGINSPADWSAQAAASQTGSVAVQAKVYAAGAGSGADVYPGARLAVGGSVDPFSSSSSSPLSSSLSPLIDGLPYVTSHYGFLLTDYYLVPLLTGQQTDIPGGSLSFAPVYPCPYTMPLVLPGTTGTITCAPAPGNPAQSQYTVSVAFGSLTLPTGGLSIAGAAYPSEVNLGPGESVSWTA